MRCRDIVKICVVILNIAVLPSAALAAMPDEAIPANAADVQTTAYGVRYTYADGGTTYRVEIFSAVGSHLLTLPSAVGDVDYLVVAGGGGGGGTTGINCGGGGGGGGGVRNGTVAACGGAALSVQVGAGGASATGDYGVNGGDSSVAFAIADEAVRLFDAKGGGGGAKGQIRTSFEGLSGGCGGGAGAGSTGGAASLEASDGLAHGNVGGAGITAANISWGGGGGGACLEETGKGGAPVRTDTSVKNKYDGGKGGDGVANALTGVAIVYGGGGGGGAAHTSNGIGGAGGLGGGGDGSAGGKTTVTPGVDGLGGGGGGMGGGQTAAAIGARGGSGLVVVRYAVTPEMHEHRMGDWRLLDPPTCTEAGTSNRVCTATGCTVPPLEETCVAPPLGHDFANSVWTTNVVPTCWRTGERQCKCSRCDVWETEPIAKLLHAWGEWVTDVAPTRQAAGHRYRDCTCAECDAREEESVPALRPDLFVWTDGGADRNWTTGENWTDGLVPFGTEDVRFADGATNVVAVDAAVANPAARTMRLGEATSVTLASDAPGTARTLSVGTEADTTYELVPADSELTVSGAALEATFANMTFAGTIRAQDGATISSADAFRFGNAEDRPRLVATDGATIDLPKVQFASGVPTFVAGPDARIDICGISVHKDGLSIELNDGVLSARNSGNRAYLQLGRNGSGAPGAADVVLRGKKSQLHSTERVNIGQEKNCKPVTVRLFPDPSWTDADAAAKFAGSQINVATGLVFVVDVAAFNGRRVASRIPLFSATSELNVSSPPEVRVVENGEETDFVRRLCDVAIELNADGKTADLVVTPKRDPGLVVELGPEAEAPQSETWTADFRLKFDFPADPSDLAPTAPVAFTLADDEAGALHFVGWTEGVAHWLSGPASLADWQSVRIEARRMGERTYVGFATVGADGAATQLADANGVTWFAMSDEAVRSVAAASFSGLGRHEFAGLRRDTSDDQPVLYWIGGESGDWNAATNWSETPGGEPAGRVPTNELVRVTGSVRFVRGDETAVVGDFLGRVDAAGGIELYSGVVRTPVTLDTTRPRAGKALTLEAASFGGLAPNVLATWYRRGANESAAEYAPVAEGAAFTPQKVDWEHWFRCVWTGEDGEPVAHEFYFSKLPVLYLTTDDGETPTAEKEKHDGHVLVQGNDEWKSLYDGKMTINVRGNSTATEDKKPWKLKLDEKTKMFDIAKSKHWVLLANAIDKSNMRNKLAYDFANAIGSLGMHSTWVECVLNGEWQGLYLFCEHIRVDKSRVNVFDWEGAGEELADLVAADHGFAKADKKALETAMAEDLAWVDSGKVTYDDVVYDLTGYAEYQDAAGDITGGYIFEFDGKLDAGQRSVHHLSLGSGGKMPTQLNAPEFLDSNERMFGWTKDYLQTYFDATTSVDGYAEGRHYSEYCDVDSMVAYFLVMEMCGNFDCSQFSRYAYKERGELLKFGPVWDFDFDMGNIARQTAKDGRNIMDPCQWQVQHCDSAKGNVCFYKEWADDPWFCMLLHRRYWNVARAEFVRMIASIDGYDDYLREPATANGEKWRKYDTYSAAVARLKTYLTTRLAWMDEQFADVPTLMASLEAATHSETFGYVPSAWPYVRDEPSLEIGFNGDARAPSATVAVGSGEVATVACYLNGLRVGTAQAAGGTVSFALPSGVVGTESESCLALVAYRADGQTVVARNYAFVKASARPEPEPPVFVTGGQALVFGGEPGARTLRMAIANPQKGVYYTVFTTTDLAAGFTAEGESRLFDSDEEVLALEIDATAPSKFAKIVVSTIPYAKGDAVR